MSDFVFLLLGAFVGFIISISGVGGGVLMTPTLILLGIPPSTAIATDFLYVLFTKLLITFLKGKKGKIDYKIVFYLFIGSILATLTAYFTIKSLDTTILNKIITLVLIGVLILTSIITLLDLKKERKTFNVSNLLIHVFAGFLISLLVFFSSVGSGILLTLYLLYFTRLDHLKIVGTSILYGLLISALSLLIYSKEDFVDYKLATLLIIGTIFGVPFGHYIEEKMHFKHFKKIIAILSILSALIVGIKLYLG